VIRIAPGIETSSGRKKKRRSGGKNCGGVRESAGRWRRSGDMSYDVTVHGSTLLLRLSPRRLFVAGIGWAKRER